MARVAGPPPAAPFGGLGWLRRTIRTQPAPPPPLGARQPAPLSAPLPAPPPPPPPLVAQPVPAEPPAAGNPIPTNAPGGAAQGQSTRRLLVSGGSATAIATSDLHTAQIVNRGPSPITILTSSGGTYGTGRILHVGEELTGTPPLWAITPLGLGSTVEVTGE